MFHHYLVGLFKKAIFVCHPAEACNELILGTCTKHCMQLSTAHQSGAAVRTLTPNKH